MENQNTGPASLISFLQKNWKEWVPFSKKDPNCVEKTATAKPQARNIIHIDEAGG